MSPPDRSARSLLSGERRGLLASTLRLLLLALTPLYRLALALRAALYAVGLKRVRRPSIPVVSVGNLTVGGTGKSPFVTLIVRRLREIGRRPAVVSRGYAARPGETSDESRVIRRAVPGVIHVEDPVRARGADRATREGADVVVLDDAFQHRACARDLDVVLVDATEPFGHGHLLPRGLLREPLSALRRADALVVTRADQVDGNSLATLRSELERRAPGTPVLIARHAPVEVHPLGREAAEDPRTLSGRRVVALSGIARPDAFERTLRDLGADVVDAVRHPDHHAFSPADLADARDRAVRSNADAVVTTRKDAVKLEELPDEGAPPVLVLDVEIEIVEGDEVLRERLAALPSAAGGKLAAGASG